jgi:hypothetical protein
MNAAVIFVCCSSSVQVSVPYRMVRIANVLCICNLLCFWTFECCRTRLIIPVISKIVLNFFVTSPSLSYDIVQSK